MTTVIADSSSPEGILKIESAAVTIFLQPWVTKGQKICWRMISETNTGSPLRTSRACWEGWMYQCMNQLKTHRSYHVKDLEVGGLDNSYFFQLSDVFTHTRICLFLNIPKEEDLIKWPYLKKHKDTGYRWHWPSHWDECFWGTRTLGVGRWNVDSTDTMCPMHSLCNRVNLISHQNNSTQNRNKCLKHWQQKLVHP